MVGSGVTSPTEKIPNCMRASSFRQLSGFRKCRHPSDGRHACACRGTCPSVPCLGSRDGPCPAARRCAASEKCTGARRQTWRLLDCLTWPCRRRAIAFLPLAGSGAGLLRFSRSTSRWRAGPPHRRGAPGHTARDCIGDCLAGAGPGLSDNAPAAVVRRRQTFGRLRSGTQTASQRWGQSTVAGTAQVRELPGRLSGRAVSPHSLPAMSSTMRRSRSIWRPSAPAGTSSSV